LDALTDVLLSGYRFIDFEIYSMNSKTVVGHGGVRHQYTCCPRDECPDKAPPDTTVASNTPEFPFPTVMEAMARVKQIAFGEAGNKNDPLFILFRIKDYSNGGQVYKDLYDAIISNLSNHILPYGEGFNKKVNYGYGGTKLGNNRKIGDLPLFALRRKVVICVEDICNHKDYALNDTKYKNFYKIVNLIAGGPYLDCYTYSNFENSDKEQMKTDSQGKIIVVYPHYAEDSSIASSAKDWQLRHNAGVQVAMVRHRAIKCNRSSIGTKVLLGENDETQGYLDIFKGNGAFVNKSTDLLAPKPVVATVAKSTDSKKDLTADTSKVSTITGKKMEFKGAKENGK